MTKTEKAVERQNLIDILDRNFGYTDDEPAHVVADRLIAAGYRKQSDTVKEFAEKLKDGLDRKCRDHGATDMRILQTQGNLLYKAYQLIDDLAKQFGKEDK